MPESFFTFVVRGDGLPFDLLTGALGEPHRSCRAGEARRPSAAIATRDGWVLQVGPLRELDLSDDFAAFVQQVVTGADVVHRLQAQHPGVGVGFAFVSYVPTDESFPACVLSPETIKHLAALGASFETDPYALPPANASSS